LQKLLWMNFQLSREVRYIHGKNSLTK
jgi:hypothetical protein